MDVTQILSAFNLSNREGAPNPQVQQNTVKNLSTILGSQAFNGQTLQAYGGNSYTTQIIINPKLSDIPQEIILRTSVDLKNLPSFTVDVENVTLADDGPNILINFAGKINTSTEISNPNINGTIKISDPAIQKLLTSNEAISASPIAKFFNSDLSSIKQIPDNLQTFFSNNKIPAEFLPQALQGQNISVNSVFSLKLVSVKAEGGENLLRIEPQNPVSQKILTGKVEYISANKETIIKTEIGNFRISGQINIPNNSAVSFRIENFENSQAGKTVDNFTSLTLLKSSVASDILSMQNSARLLSVHPVGSLFLNKLFPNSTEKQAYSKALYLISKASNMDIGKIINQSLEGFDLGGGKTELSEFIDHAKSLLQYIRDSGVRYGTSSGENFYSYILPFYNNDKLEFQRFYVFQEKADASKINKEGHFAVELEQEGHGKMEIEGVYNKAYDRLRQLDIIIRSEFRFGDETKSELRRLYADTAELMGFTGNLTFQAMLQYSPHAPYGNNYGSQDDGIVI